MARARRLALSPRRARALAVRRLRIDALFPLWVVQGLLIPAVAGGLLTLSWTGALLGFCWGGLARVFLAHHVTWSVNSICHLWGAQPFRGDDESRNNAIVGVLALGEGWHNNHHAFPTSAFHGLRRLELDPGGWLILALERTRLAWKVTRVAPDRQQARLLHVAGGRELSNGARAGGPG